MTTTVTTESLEQFTQSRWAAMTWLTQLLEKSPMFRFMTRIDGMRQLKTRGSGESALYDKEGNTATIKLFDAAGEHVADFTIESTQGLSDVAVGWDVVGLHGRPCTPEEDERWRQMADDCHLVEALTDLARYAFKPFETLPQEEAQ